MPLSPGTGLGHYEILAPLGSGGMGEVYLAQDARLRRKVALKVLPEEVATDSHRMRRFQREATAAAALNHPHIAHIYEIGEADGIHFIAMEFVDGETLREKIHRDKAPLTKLLKYLVQTAEGLTKAHAAGIVHRDLKPDNIMITRDDYAKILDFGLAKLIEPDAAFAGSGAPLSELPTAVMPQHSQPGMVMGTSGYMSPEQAQGRVAEIDHRSDIFSFGCILFEASTGHKAFEGADALDSLHKIVHGPVPQIKEFYPLAPAEIQRIVQRCLAKDPNKRYHSIKDVAIDLDEVRQELKTAETQSSVAPNAPAVSTQNGIAPTQQRSAATTVGATHSVSSAEYIVTEIKRHKGGIAIAFVALLIVIGVVSLAAYKLLNGRHPFAAGPLTITRLTSTGHVNHATISPDGRYLVYALDEGATESLWMTQAATSSNVQIVPSAELHYQGLTFSRDGNFIYYVRLDKDNPSGALFQMPAFGGNARKLLTNILSSVTLSPDGKQLAFMRCEGCLKASAWKRTATGGSGVESSLIVANSDGSAERVVSVKKIPEIFSPGGPAWSPDGKFLACGTTYRGRGKDDGGPYRNVVAVRVSDGTEQPITSKRWNGPGLTETRITWLADTSGVLVSGITAPDLSQIWYLSWPGNEARTVNSDLNSYTDISTSADSSTMVAIRSDRVINLWVAPSDDIGAAKRITSGAERGDGERGISWTPDGQIVYFSRQAGNENIWIMRPDGSANKQVSPTAPQNVEPVVSPDGRYVVWASRPSGQWELWRMDIDGSNPRKIANGGYYQDVSRDGKWIFYSPPTARLFKVPIEGGEPAGVTDASGLRPTISPDGQWLAFTYEDEDSRSTSNMGPINPITSGVKIAILPTSGGTPTKIFDTASNRRIISWTPDGHAVAYVVTNAGVSNIWAQPIDGGRPKQLTHFTSENIFNFAWSRDGKQLALSRGVVNRDVVLIGGLK